MTPHAVNWKDLASVVKYCDGLNIAYGRYKQIGTEWKWNPTVVVKYPKKDYYQIMHYHRAVLLEKRGELDIIKQSIPSKDK